MDPRSQDRIRNELATGKIHPEIPSNHDLHIEQWFLTGDLRA